MRIEGDRRHAIAFDSRFYDSSKIPRYGPIVDPVRNPFAPGAGQRPPELAGRDRELDAFEIVLERVARGRPERSLVLTGLRGVGKTVLLGELRSMAVRAGWGAGKIEARPEADLRRPLSAALHRAIRDLAVHHSDLDRVDEVLGVLKAFALRSSPEGAKLRDRWQPGIDVAVRSGRADSGDIEIDLVELFTEVATLASDVESGVAILIDEMQDLRPDDVSALCAACHELSQSRAPLVVVGAGLPHLPAVLSASKSYSERLFTYVAHRPARPRRRRLRPARPGRTRGRHVRRRRPRRPLRRVRRLPLLRPGLRQGELGRRGPLADHRGRRQDGRAGGRGGARRRLLRLPLRARHPGRARVPARDGRAHRRPRRADRHRGHRRSPAAAGLVALARLATAS